MKIGILCAGDEELAPFLPLISNCKITEKAMLKFHNLLYALKISTLNEFRFIGEIAKPAEPVNGQDERRINAPPLTVPPVFAKG